MVAFGSTIQAVQARQAGDAVMLDESGMIPQTFIPNTGGGESQYVIVFPCVDDNEVKLQAGYRYREVTAENGLIEYICLPNAIRIMPYLKGNYAYTSMSASPEEVISASNTMMLERSVNPEVCVIYIKRLKSSWPQLAPSSQLQSTSIPAYTAGYGVSDANPLNLTAFDCDGDIVLAGSKSDNAIPQLQKKDTITGYAFSGYHMTEEIASEALSYYGIVGPDDDTLYIKIPCQIASTVVDNDFAYINVKLTGESLEILSTEDPDVIVSNNSSLSAVPIIPHFSRLTISRTPFD